MVAQRREICPVDSWDLIRKTLYLRYLKADQIDDALAQMRDIQAYFATQDRDFIDWGQIGAQSPTVLNPNQATMADIFAVFFRKFEETTEGAKYFIDHGLDYGPLKIIIATPVVRAVIEARRSLAEFDALADDAIPFWARPDAPNQLSREEYIAKGMLGKFGPYSDDLIKSWSKNKMNTVEAKRYAANDMTNHLRPDQRKFLLMEAEAQEAKAAKRR